LIKSKIIQEFRYFSRYFSADSRYFPIYGSRWAQRGPAMWALASGRHTPTFMNSVIVPGF